MDKELPKLGHVHTHACMHTHTRARTHTHTHTYTYTHTHTQWLDIQEQWRQLESVLTSPTMAQSFGKEAAQFEAISSSWVELMESAKEMPGVVECCDGDISRVGALDGLRERLEHCKKSLSLYLLSKRQVGVVLSVCCLHHDHFLLPVYVCLSLFCHLRHFRGSSTFLMTLSSESSPPHSPPPPSLPTSLHSSPALAHSSPHHRVTRKTL